MELRVSMEIMEMTGGCTTGDSYFVGTHRLPPYAKHMTLRRGSHALSSTTSPPPISPSPPPISLPSPANSAPEPLHRRRLDRATTPHRHTAAATPLTSLSHTPQGVSRHSTPATPAKRRQAANVQPAPVTLSARSSLASARARSTSSPKPEPETVRVTAPRR